MGEGAVKAMESNQNHGFYPNERAEKDDEEEDIRRTQGELGDWVEEIK